MILQQKLLLYKLFILTTLLLLTIIPLLFVFSGALNVIVWLTIILIVLASLVFFRWHHLRIASESTREFDTIQERMNLLTESIAVKKKILESLPLKQEKIALLFELSQKLIELSNAEEIFDFIINTLGDLFPKADNVLVFDFDKDNLSLIRSLKRKDTVIKEKTGDALDKWVLRHNRSLIIEDLSKDFRFDFNKIKAFKDREAYSFIASPFSIGYRLLGTVRLESKVPASFDHDDSRILRNICDLAAVVLERARLFEKLQDLAIKDSLTSLFLRDYFFQRVNEELRRAKENDSKVGIIMLDIDDFKKINDTHGHIVGDFVLKKLARILKTNIVDTENIASRFGGEEFMISIIESNKKDLLRIAEALRKSVEKAELAFRRKKIHFTISLGVVLYPEDGGDLMKLVKKVDELMYKAKQKGKNRVCYTGQ